MMRGKKKEGQGEEENTRFQQVQPSPLEHLVSHKLQTVFQYVPNKVHFQLARKE